MTGSEAEKTNQMLQALAIAAQRIAHGEITMPQILQTLTQGNNNQTNNNNNEQNELTQIEINKPTTPDNKKPPQPIEKPQIPNNMNDTNNKKQNKKNKNLQPPITQTNSDKQESSVSPRENNSDQPLWIIQTRETLGKVITRPRLLDKLLTRPPFRYAY